MTLATDLGGFVYGVDVAMLEARVVTDTKTLITDALACIIAGAGFEGARIARAMAPEHASDNKQATILLEGLRTGTASAALINGAMLRSLDLMDVYVGRDVCHPSEIIPPALACAEAGAASGKMFLEAVVAGLALHMQLADFIPLHRHGLHHVGQAAWTVPLIAARLLGHDKAIAARALTIGAHAMVVPESFSLGQLTNLKALAYPLLARQGIEAVRLAIAGLTGAPQACEEVVKLLSHRFAMDIPLQDLVPASAPDDVSVISLKIYPAQYALQPLIATASTIRGDSKMLEQIERIIVRASWRTVERCADPAKYVPRSAEAADHSLPFCVAIAMLEGKLTIAALEKGRWKDEDVLALMSRIKAKPMNDDDGYHVGAQDITLQMKDGKFRTFPCRYPPEHVTWAMIAEQKLRQAAAKAGLDAEKILDVVSKLETEPSLDRLVAAMTRVKAAEPASTPKPAPAPTASPPAPSAPPTEASSPGAPTAADIPQKKSA
jgi:2-methylcitrate dehydratase